MDIERAPTTEAALEAGSDDETRANKPMLQLHVEPILAKAQLRNRRIAAATVIAALTVVAGTAAFSVIPSAPAEQASAGPSPPASREFSTAAHESVAVAANVAAPATGSETAGAERDGAASSDAVHSLTASCARP